MTTESPVSVIDFNRLMKTTEVITNWRALALTSIVLIAIALCAMLTTYAATHSIVAGGLLGILTLLVALVGYSAIGIFLMRHNQGQDVGIMDAFMQAFFCTHRIFGVAIMMALIFLALVLVVMLLFLICKIPGIGAFFLAILFPIIALTLGVTIVALFGVCGSFAYTAIWEGNTVLQVVSRLMAIARHRLLAAILNLVVLGLLVGFISAVIFSILSVGSFTATSLSAPFGFMMSFTNFIPSTAGGMGGMSGMGDTSHASALMFAFALLFALGSIIPALLLVNGTCLVYLQVTEGLDFSETEKKLRENLDEAKRRAQEARDQAQAKMAEAREKVAEAKTKAAEAKAQEQASAAAPAADAPATATETPAPRACANCAAPLGADDVFCSHCGTKNPL